MELLLDTHLVIWAATQSELLPPGARTVMGAPENALVFSVASIWEVAIKKGLARSDFDLDPLVLRRSLLERGYRELPILGAHALAVAALPPLHKDPFDRILVGQSIAEGITLLTADPVVARYPGPVRLFRR